MIKDRKRKKICWHSVHVPKQMIKRKLFSSVKKGFMIIKKAVKGRGILIDSMREDCKYFCIFKSDIKKQSWGRASRYDLPPVLILGVEYNITRKQWKSGSHGSAGI